MVTNDNYKYDAISVEQMGIAQRWLVVYSKAANERAQQSIIELVAKERKALDKALFHLQAQRFAYETDAKRALTALEKKQKYHQLQVSECIAHKQYEGKGRPKKDAPAQSIHYQLVGAAHQNE